ncbi:neuronal growth regulator 1 [Turdus rufiventris]|nr:neuronal growth regulator 1 [Turdus rufiventris]
MPGSCWTCLGPAGHAQILLAMPGSCWTCPGPAGHARVLLGVPRCYLEDGASKGAWLNRSSIIFAGSDKWSVDPRVSIATANRREYSLQIQDVDVTDDGPYTCSVQTQHTPRTMQVHLTVQVSPKIFRISSDIVVNEGSNVTLVCLATGKPEPSISWRHISPSAKPFESGQYLDIYGITRDQAGEYECSAENDVSVPDVKKVKVTVNCKLLLLWQYAE